MSWYLNSRNDKHIEELIKNFKIDRRKEPDATGRYLQNLMEYLSTKYLIDQEIMSEPKLLSIVWVNVLIGLMLLLVVAGMAYAMIWVVIVPSLNLLNNSSNDARLNFIGIVLTVVATFFTTRHFYKRKK